MTEPKNNTLIVWDLETTGLDAKAGAKILEIGALVVEDDKVVSTHQWVLDHKIKVPEEIVKITGITDDIIAKEGRDPAECLVEFWSLFQKAGSNLTHNGIRFDIPFMVEAFKQVLGYDDASAGKVRAMLEENALDTAAMYKGKRLNMARKPGETFKQYADRVMEVRMYGLKYNVGACCDDLKVDRSSIVQHRAVGDITLTLEIYRKLTGPVAA